MPPGMEYDVAKKTNRFVFLLKSLLRSKTGFIGLLIVIGVVFTALFAPQLAPQSPYTIDLDKMLLPPAWMEGGES
ncbi:hypothetical protein HMPREF0322_00550 [Desulfitobacterium hafniense DP7]|uniref:Oligopeptide transport permease C-like N-terminal domain-containing protein n=2 Tax=Desulfitobacterium hafniense TaxID=49338 RepID=G9XHX4_DESHA|nr:hypothetical protein HMPREF0322_00550 [Desulfitobacterium hafniense DP7]